MYFMFVKQNFAFICCFRHAFKRLLEMTAIVITWFLFFQEEDKPLEQATLQIISDSICNSTYPFSGRITDRMICAQDPIDGKGACGVIWLR
jgi:hypothetical protein